MQIGLIAPPWVPVPPVGSGDTEQVMDDLARGLTWLGHDASGHGAAQVASLVPSTSVVRHMWSGATVEEAAFDMELLDDGLPAVHREWQWAGRRCRHRIGSSGVSPLM
jgi:hypothetical protein